MKKTVTAILVAGGSSSRMGFDKLALPLGQSTVLGQSLAAFEQHPYVTEIVLVHGKNIQLARQEAKKHSAKPITLVAGGATRAESVANGMQAAKGEIVAIHDAARPFVSRQLITQVLEAAFRCGAAAPAVPVKDTIKQAAGGLVTATPPRHELWAVQTPQCFERAKYLELLARNPAMDLTDDCQLFEQAGLPVCLTAGDYENKKLTTPDDVKGEKQMRIGHGYDVHKLAENRKLILGGVEVPYEKGLAGHSDADVLTHAVMDALLGAAAMGDIGKHFPDTDPAYKGADSIQLAKEVAKLLAEKGYTVENIDATLLCQAPKLAPHIPAMRQNLANALGMEVERVSVKATTEEHLGFTGQGLGIAAHAVCLLNG